MTNQPNQVITIKLNAIDEFFSWLICFFFFAFSTQNSRKISNKTSKILLWLLKKNSGRAKYAFDIQSLSLPVLSTLLNFYTLFVKIRSSRTQQSLLFLILNALSLSWRFLSTNIVILENFSFELWYQVFFLEMLMINAWEMH